MKNSFSPRLFLLFIFFPFFTFSKETLSVRGPYSQVDLLSSHQSFSPEEKITFGLRFTLEDEWHIYWKNSGDSGSAPKFKWSLPEGFELGHLYWPTPRRIPLFPLTNFGYENEVIFLQEIFTPKTVALNQKYSFPLFIEWLVCKVECIPGEGNLSIEMRGSEKSILSEHADLLKKSEGYIPLQTPSTSVSLEVVDKKTYFEIDIQDPLHKTEIKSADFFPEHPLLTLHNKTPVFTLFSPYHGQLKVEKNPNFTDSIESLKGVYQFNTQSYELSIPITHISLFWQSLLFAFLGGLLLNLMPCVFPVLGLKVLSFIQSSHKSRKALFLHSLVYSSGILLSFFILNSILILLKTFGESLGWGFQLQSPVFIGFLILLFFGIGLNLLGVFEFGIFFTRFGNLAPKNQSNYAGSFFSGILAVLVATPCTAPFMGSALGYALSQPMFFSYMIFFSLALGMALPYIILCSFPQFLKFLPRPGQWMVVFKQFLAFPLLATSLWLIWVLGHQTGVDGILYSLCSLLLFAMGIWLFTLFISMNKKGMAYFLTFLSILVLFSSALFLVFHFIPKSLTTKNSSTEASSTWLEFSEELIKDAQKKGSPVFIDFTAAWCITCQVNKKTVLETKPILEAFQKNQVTLIRADWTYKNLKITEFLARFGRQGVPVYLFYSSDNTQEPMLLPEILTPSIVLNALETVLSKTQNKSQKEK